MAVLTFHLAKLVTEGAMLVSKAMDARQMKKLVLETFDARRLHTMASNAEVVDGQRVLLLFAATG